MIPTDRQELDLLAGEYVLGTLEPDVAREVERSLTANPELGRAVTFWEERLQALSALAPPAEPPAHLWDGIAARLGSEPARARPNRALNSLALWRWSTAIACGVAACLAIYIALAPPAGGPRFVAVLRAPQANQAAAWVAAASGKGLLLRAVAVGAAPSAHAFELWAIAPGATRPLALGIIPADGRLELDALPDAIREGGTLAISIEPMGGSPTGQPTGPVVFTGTLVAAN
jgi:anti-sigma-K factor RskA